MNLSDAIKSIIRPHKDDKLTALTTVWGERLDPANLLAEYPRPQMRRNDYTVLNGLWDYAFTDTDTPPSSYDGQILVPFSPESSLSGVNRQLLPHQFLWYRTSLPIIQNTFSSHNRLLLHFGAVDYYAKLFINGQAVTSHQGGYLPFTADITDFLQPEHNELLLKVQDSTGENDEAKGKQTLERGGIFYTAQSGIWQTVWLEQVPASHVESLWFDTDYDAQKVTVHITASVQGTVPPLMVSLLAEGREIASGSIELQSKQPGSPASSGDRRSTVSASLALTIPGEDFHPWSPETPFLYDAKLCFGEDRVDSYFAMRIFSVEKQAEGELSGKPVFCLNHQPYFLMGVLDQGYWPDGLYTAPSDEALLYDIETMKSLGFNMLRKHIKVESARWYYHCDRLGMIVCQDMVNGGSHYHMPVISYLPTLSPSLSAHLKDSHYSLLSRKNKEARDFWEKECADTIQYLKFFPSIAVWVPFNEGWGQFDTVRITEMIRKLDPSRPIDSASGWFDQNCGDFVSVHNYFRPLSVSVKKWENRAFFLSEYGGYACAVKGHTSVERVFGYKRYETVEEFRSAYEELIQKSLLPLKKQGLSGAVYTQLSDVEEEVNGILTYDRKVNKLS
ncbi:MAG: glycoside hydrolase family 2 [Lachnospiraceae bacterium]|nr:glycoside hydrolase family 2 [Lachnospiraceae bacterium]